MRVGIVGCGGIAKVHAKCINNMKDHQLVGFVDCKKERADSFALTYGGNSYRSLEEMFENETIDVLHICTPHYLHSTMAEYGLKHNSHVFMEKPPVINKEQLEKLRQVVLNSDRKLGLCFQNRYNKSIIAVKKLIESGEVGKVLGARGIVTWCRNNAYYTESDWRGRLDTEGGGVLINQSIHTLDLLNYLIDDTPLSIDAFITNHHLQGVIEVEDTMSAFIQYPKAKACFYATTSYIVDSSPMIEIECENMRIRIEDLDVTFYDKEGSSKKISYQENERFGKNYWGSGHFDCISNFYDSIIHETEFAQDLEHMDSTIRLMLGAYQSGRTGKTVIF